METIKVGDTVRVRELPKIYERIGSRIVQDYKCRVVKIDDGMALLDSIPAKHTFLFPLKYIVKVGGEEKEPRFKKGDKVRYVGKETEYRNEVFVVDGEEFYNDYHKEMQVSSVRCERYNVCNIPIRDLEPYTEPAEEEIKVRTDGSDYLREALDDTCKPQCGGLIVSSLIHLGDTDWDAYTADLAKEIAVKAAYSTYTAEEVAEYAVKVAKSVVEELKKK